MSQISIAIPCHDRGENGPKWLRELFDSIKSQTFQDIDIVVSDQSKNDNILDVCKEYSDDFEFTYVRYEGSCLLYTSPSPRDQRGSRMPSSA